MPARLNRRRRAVGAFAALCVAAAIPMTSNAAPLGLSGAVPPPARGVTDVENRLIPRWLGGDRQQQVVLPENSDVRIDQLETQVRNLTGQVEQLTFALRRLEAAMADGRVPQGATPGPGAPPRNLAAPAGTPQVSEPVAPALPSGPIDLSALNSGAPQPSQPVQNQAPPPANTDELSRLRSLYQSGRYAMAQQEAEALLAKTPTGAEAGEARFVLGEALLAQGDYREAANQFLENYTSDPNGSRAPASLLRLGTSLNGLGEKEAACSSLEELFNVYPNVDGQLRAEAERERRAANCA